MQETTDITFMLSEQHKGTSKSRVIHGSKDLRKILNHFSFIYFTHFCGAWMENIANGFLADNSIDK